MPDIFETWGKTEAKDLPRAFRAGTTAVSPSTGTTYYAEEVALTTASKVGVEILPAARDSTSNNTTVSLLAGGTFTGVYDNTEGYVAFCMLIATTDGANGTDGVRVQWSEDGVNTLRTETLFYTTADANNGSAFYTLPIEADFVRVLYHNGSTNQTAFTLATNLSPIVLQVAQVQVESAISGIDVASLSKSIASAPNDGGVYGVINRSAGTIPGLRVSVSEAEAEMPIKALDSWATTMASITTAAGGQQVGSPGLAHRKTISLKADPSNARTVYVGATSAVSPSNGYPLGAGDSVDLEISTAVSIYAISATSPQLLAWAEVASST